MSPLYSNGDRLSSTDSETFRTALTMTLPICWTGAGKFCNSNTFLRKNKIAIMDVWVNERILSHRNPLQRCLGGHLAEHKIVWSRHRSIGVDGFALKGVVAISLEIIARGSGSQTYASFLEADGLSKLTRTTASSDVCTVLASQFAELAFIDAWYYVAG